MVSLFIIWLCLSVIQVTYKFRCMVRVMATWPSDVLDFCVLEQGDFVYAVRLTLEDPTARLHCFLYGEDAVRLLGPDEDSKKNCCLEFFTYVIRPNAADYGFCELQVEFFVGYPAVNLRQQGDTVGALKRKVDRLLGICENGPPNPPWVNCCLKSYYLDKEHSQESRRFRIFGTRFPG